MAIWTQTPVALETPFSYLRTVSGSEVIARLPQLVFLAVLLGFALLGARSECDSNDELLHNGISSQDRGTVQWTPDGSKIVFSGSGKIVVADSSGTHLQTIPQGPVATFPFLEDNTPRVSPDGSRVAYVTYRYSKGITKRHSDEIATANIDGSDHRRLTSDRYDYGEPAWSPDGSQIAFVSKGGRLAKEDGRYGIFVVDSDGGSDPRLLGPPKDLGLTYKYYTWFVVSPVWSPNGEFIVFLHSVYTDDLRVYIAAIRPDGSGYRRIHEISSLESYYLDPVSFSPDGSRLVFALHEDNTAVIRTINFDGSDPRDVLSIPITYEMRGRPPPGAAASRFQFLDHIAWSPDGSEIIFAGISESSNDPQSLVSGIHAIGVDGTGLRTLLEFYGSDYQNGLWPVALSPDGSRFAVLRAPHYLVSSSGGIRHPDDAWYRQRQSEEHGVILFTLAADGTDNRVLVREVDEVFTAERSTRTAAAGVRPGGQYRSRRSTKSWFEIAKFSWKYGMFWPEEGDS